MRASILLFAFVRTFGALWSAPRWLVASHGRRLYYLARRTRSYRVSGKLLNVVSCRIDMAYNTDTACEAWATAAEGCFIPNKSPLRLRSRSAMRSTSPHSYSHTDCSRVFLTIITSRGLSCLFRPTSSCVALRIRIAACRWVGLGWVAHPSSCRLHTR